MPKSRKPLFERVKRSLEEAVRHAQDEITLKTTEIELPDPPPKDEGPERGTPGDDSGLAHSLE